MPTSSSASPTRWSEALALTSKLPKRTQNLLLLANVLMLVVIVADMFYLTGMIEGLDLPLFTLVNLLVLGLGLWSFRVKRSLRRQAGGPQTGGSESGEPEPGGSAGG